MGFGNYFGNCLGKFYVLHWWVSTATLQARATTIVTYTATIETCTLATYYSSQILLGLAITTSSHDMELTLWAGLSCCCTCCTHTANNNEMESSSTDASCQHDCRGILRGNCLTVGCDCDGYNGGDVGKKCVGCHHPPGKHKNLTQRAQDDFPSIKKAAPLVLSAEEPQQLRQSDDAPLLKPLPRSTDAPLLVEDIEPLDMDQIICGDGEQLNETCIYRNCKRRRFKDKDKTHEFCGRTHAERYRAELSSSNPGVTCKTPGCTNGRYRQENGDYFDYCSLYCRDNQQKGGQLMLEPSKRGICSLPNCEEFKYQDPSNGRIHEFCCRSHAQAGVSTATGVDVVKISKVTSEEHSTITKKFTTNWASQKGKCPPIEYIFTVSNTKLKQRWEQYKSTLSTATIEEYFHGTKLECDITSTNSLCSSEECGVCGIANIGFDRRCIAKNIPRFQRFGHGFYLAPQSSKCHDYTQGKSGYRAMLLFDVCPGEKYMLQRDNETITAPPQGFNSVYGQRGQSLNYDELVIYNPDGALPKYIIVYRKDGDKKIAT